MELLQSIFDFIEVQGIVSFVVLALAVLMYRQQNQMQGMIENQKIESAQQGKLITVLTEQSKNKDEIVAKVDDTKNELLNEARAISKASSDDRHKVATSLDNNTESVNNMKEELVKLADVTEAVRAAIEALTKDGVVLSSEAHQSIVDSVVESLSSKITDMQECIEQAIETATQEAPKVEPPIMAKSKTQARITPQGKEGKTG